ELFHVINHTTKDRLHPTDPRMTAYDKGEKLADHFAGCLLMPKQHVKALAGEGLNPSDLADTFGVSLRAMTVRLTMLGVAEPPPPAAPPANSFRRVVTPAGHLSAPWPSVEGEAA